MGLISRVSSRTYRMTTKDVGKGPPLAVKRRLPPKIPQDPVKLPRSQRIKNFFNLKKRFTPMFIDYRSVATDFVKNIPKHKMYYAPRIIGAGLLTYALVSVPTKMDYKYKLVQAKTDMIATGCNRNRRANKYIQSVVQLEAKKLLTYEDQWIFSVIRKMNYSETNCSAEAYYDRQGLRWWNPITWYYSLPRYLNSVVDIGIFGHYAALSYSLAAHQYPDVDLTILGEQTSQVGSLPRLSEISNAIQHQIPGLQPTYPQVPQHEQTKMSITSSEY